MKIEEIKEKCTGCGACASFCPKECITMPYDKEGFYYPSINHDRCISCGICEKKCHVINPLKKQDLTARETYYGWNLIDEERMLSTSGGAFIALAKNVILDDGVVYGAYFDVGDYTLKQVSTDDIELKKLLKSKYIESNMSLVIKDIQSKINENKKILFCGTPCEVSGVKKAISDKNGLLLTVDFICHGVPSSKLFKEYLENRIKGQKLLDIDFRPKDKGWASKNIALTTTTTTTTTITPYIIDSFYYGFMCANAFLRRSCYNCDFRQNHVSDISVADFWRYKDIDPKLYSEKGLSLLIGNTSKGIESIRLLKNFELHQVDNKCSDYLYACKDYSGGLKFRYKFYKLYEQYGFEKAAEKTYFKDPLLRKLKYNTKQIIKKLMRRDRV